MEATELISALIAELQRAGMASPGRTRLVKLAYLTELEYYRRTRLRLTDLAWIFHHYGPYAHALSNLVGGPDDPAAEIETVMAPIARATLDSTSSAILRNVVQDWGDADLNQLLDHVYFETEPMEDAYRGQRLDFTSALPRPPKGKPLELDRSKLRALRTRAAKSAAAYSVRPLPAVITPALADGLRIWDEDGATRLAPGPCALDPDDLL